MHLIPPKEKQTERIQHLWLTPLTFVLFSVSLSKTKTKSRATKVQFLWEIKKKNRKETAPTRMLIQTWKNIYKDPQLIINIFYTNYLCRESLTYIYENNFPHLTEEQHDSIIFLSLHTASSVPIPSIYASIRARKITKAFHIHNQYPDPREWTGSDGADVRVTVLLRSAERSSRGGLHSYLQGRLLEGTESATSSFPG